jgi:hypothetical protein
MTEHIEASAASPDEPEPVEAAASPDEPLASTNQPEPEQRESRPERDGREPERDESEPDQHEHERLQDKADPEQVEDGPDQDASESEDAAWSEAPDRTETAAPPPQMSLTSTLRSGITAVYAIAALFAASLVIVLMGRATGQEALTLVGGYGVVFFGVGAAPFQLNVQLDLYARLTAAVVVGFTALFGIGALMGDLHGAWQPIPAAVVVGGIAAVLHLEGVLRAGAIRLPKNERSTLPQTEAQAAAARALRTSLLLTACGTAMWLAPALWTRDLNPTYWGMLPKLGPLWFAGLGVLMIAFVIGRKAEISALAATLSFGLASTLTPALVYLAPRATTASKQMQITQYLILHHHIDPTSGIYPAFSAMFAGMAWFSELLHIQGMLGHHSLFAIATYWPVLLVFMRIAVLRLLAGRLLPTTGRRWCVVMLVLLVDSLGADYFSPQSVGYVMAVGLAAIAVNGIGPRPFGNRTTFLLLLFGGAVLAPTHELSPYMLAGALVVLAVFGQAPWWAWIPVSVTALGWAAVVRTAVQGNFNFGTLFELSNFRPPVTLSTPGLERLPIIAYQSHTLLLALLILIGLGAIGFFANVRRRRSWGYALCPIVGIGLIAINPYGNEGIFRATLFAIPWMAVLAMTMPNPLRLFRRKSILNVAIATCLAGLLFTFVVATYSLDATGVLQSSDVAAADYVARLPPRHAYVLSLGSGDNPVDPTPKLFNYVGMGWEQVSTVPALVGLHPTTADLAALADKYGFVAGQLGADRSSPLYVVWTRSLVLYANEYGLQTPKQLETWLHLLQTSPAWQQVVRYGDTYLFRLR